MLAAFSLAKEDAPFLGGFCGNPGVNLITFEIPLGLLGLSLAWGSRVSIPAIWLGLLIVAVGGVNAYFDARALREFEGFLHREATSTLLGSWFLLGIGVILMFYGAVMLFRRLSRRHN